MVVYPIISFMDMQKLEKILVIGTTGSGKTSLAKRLSKELQLARVELDAFRWNPGWVMTSDEVFIERVQKFVFEHDQWVIDGNYSIVREILWSRADLVIWLDYPLRTVLAHLFKRSFDNIRNKKPLCNGNFETLWLQLSKKSIFLWALKTYWKKRKRYLKLMKEHPYSNLRFIRVRSTRELEEFFQEIQPSAEEKPGFPSKR